MQSNQELDKLLQKHRVLFQDELGILQVVAVKLHVDTRKSRGSFRQVGSPRRH